MDIGVSTATFFLRKYNEESIAQIQGLGGETCEVFLECPSEYTEEYGKVLLKNKGSLKVHSVHAVTMNYETELFSPFDRSLADAMKSFGGVLNIGKMLGAKFYTMHGRARIKKNGNYDDYEINGKKIDKLCDFASNYDIRICLENVPWALYNKPNYFKCVLKYAPNLCATLDLKQARISGYDYKDYLYEMADRLKTIHISDVDKNGKIRLPSFGVFNFDELFKILSSEGFDGSMIIEVYKDDFGNDEEITKSLNYLKELKYKYF